MINKMKVKFLGHGEHDRKEYSITLINDDGKRMTTPYNQGSAIKGEPTLKDILYCICMDAMSWYDYKNIDDFADNYCYQQKPSEIIRMHKACKKAYDSLVRFGYTIDDMAKISQEEI